VVHIDTHLSRLQSSDVKWKIFPYRKFSAIFFQKIFCNIFPENFPQYFFQKIFRFLKSSLNISFFNLFLVALGLGGFESCMCSYLTVAVSVGVTTSQAQGHKKGVE
jgi:hypothetical protein